MKLTITNDISPQHPRKDWEPYGTLAYKSKYTLGEEEIHDPIDFLAYKLGLSDDQVQRIADKNDWFYYSTETLRELSVRFYREYIALPVYLYDHSGITVNTGGFNCRWDSSQVGWIYMSKEEAKKHHGWGKITRHREKLVEEYLEGEIRTLAQYLEGDVYGFEFEDDNGEIDSCWGFYGTDWKTNGLTDYLPKKAHHLLEEIEVTYEY